MGGPDAGESGGTISQFPSTAVSSGAAQGKAGGAAGVGRETGLQGSAVTHRLVPGIQSVAPPPSEGTGPIQRVCSWKLFYGDNDGNSLLLNGQSTEARIM